MGGKNSKTKGNGRPPVLEESSYVFIVNESGLDRTSVKIILNKYFSANPDNLLDKAECKHLFEELQYQPEKPKTVDIITEDLFKMFDKEGTGKISLNEFLIAYALNSKQPTRRRLEFAFDIYDLDNNGFLDKKEVTGVVTCIFEIGDVGKDVQNVSGLANKCMKILDQSDDGVVSKQEFIGELMGLLENPK